MAARGGPNVGSNSGTIYVKRTDLYVLLHQFFLFSAHVYGNGLNASGHCRTYDPGTYLSTRCRT